MAENQIVDWPTPDVAWWWMRYRPSRRSKWRVLLVRVITQDGREYVKPLHHRDCLPERICREWEASFSPAVPPPQEWLADFAP